MFETSELRIFGQQQKAFTSQSTQASESSILACIPASQHSIRFLADIFYLFMRLIQTTNFDAQSDILNIERRRCTQTEKFTNDACMTCYTAILCDMLP